MAYKKSISPSPLFIGGKWRESKSGKRFAAVNPATEEIITEVAEGTAEDANEAALAARRAFDEVPWASLKGSERA